MPIQIQISDYAATTLRELLVKELAEKREKLKAYESECKDIEILLGQLSANQIVSDNRMIVQSLMANDLGYKDSWTWEGKIKFILDFKENTGLTTSEIVAILADLEPRYIIKEERAKAVASISAVLSTKSKDGKVFYKKNK